MTALGYVAAVERAALQRQTMRVLVSAQVLGGLAIGVGASVSPLLAKEILDGDATFAGFHPQKVAGFGGRDIARILRNAEIIRNRAKIEAAIANAKATIALHRGGNSGRTIRVRRAQSLLADYQRGMCR